MGLEMVNVHKTYVTRGLRKDILRGARAFFARGERVGSLGRNGSGRALFLFPIHQRLCANFAPVRLCWTKGR